MFGFASISEFPISDFPFVAIVPPPPPPAIAPADGFTPQEAKRYQNLVKRLTNVSRARDRARVLDAKKIRQLIDDAVDPKPVVEETVVVPAESEPPRKTLKTKSLPDLNGEIYRLELQMQEMEYNRWRALELQRLQALEQERERQRDDEEALLLLL